ncbi:hypothetical protein C0993_011537 [Termitomyces sp. T159_Od127]|nr:hypothetical protein C0993_011537 [Termitomyces sp. T159_Od127]
MGSSKKNRQKRGALSLSRDDSTPQVDEDLMDELFAQLDSRDQAIQAESTNGVQTEAEKKNIRSRQDTKSRFRARQARKSAALEQARSTLDPETEAKLKKEMDDEQRDIDRICQEQLLQVHEVNPDGHCLYSAVADQLALLGILPVSQANYVVVRHAASSYMLSHQDDFLPFLEPSPSEDLSDSGMMTPEGFKRYCANICDTAEWGGEPEILALSRAYNVPIHIIQGGRPSIVTHNPRDMYSTDDDGRVVRISYHRRMYGLGEVRLSSVM